MRNFGNAIENWYGALTISAANGQVGLTTKGAANSYSVAVTAPAINNQSYGLQVVAGTTINDQAVRIQNAAGSNLLYILGDGSVTVGTTLGGKGLGTINAVGLYVGNNPVLAQNGSGGYSIGAPSAGNGLGVTGPANNYAAAFAGSPSTNQSFGVFINAGTNSIDRALHIANQANTSTLFDVYGDGQVAMTDGFGTGSLLVGYRGMPISTNTTPTLADRGKCCVVAGSVSINNGVFSGGDTFVVYNNSSSAITLSGSIPTMRLAGTTTAGARTLAPFGFASCFFPTSNQVTVGGNVT